MDYRDLAKNAVNLIASPDVCARLKTLLAEASVSVDQVAEVVEFDPVLTGQVFKVAGARDGSKHSRIDSLEEAIKIVGLDGVRGMVLSSVTAESFDGVPEDLVDPNDFWYHSTFCGLAAVILARKCDLSGAGRLFTIGLLHDIGQLPIYAQVPDLARAVLETAGQPEQYRYRAEQQLIGATHAQVGAELMRSWGLPASFWEPVEFHHEPQRASRYPVETAIVHIATNLANMMEPSWKMSLDPQVTRRGINPMVWPATGLSDADLQPTLDEVLLRSYEVTEIVSPGALSIF